MRTAGESAAAAVIYAAGIAAAFALEDSVYVLVTLAPFSIAAGWVAGRWWTLALPLLLPPAALLHGEGETAVAAFVWLMFFPVTATLVLIGILVRR
jgi:hypothetical protein